MSATGPGPLAAFLGLWVGMSAAMMLPSAAPTISLFALARGDRQRSATLPTAVFVVGYLLAWTAVGLAAYAVARALGGASPLDAMWGRSLQAAAFAAAGLYELTPLKSACLTHCRSPLGFLVRKQRTSALRVGVEHGGVCVGCCAGLMLVLVALGAMNLVWMALVAGLIVLQKVLPYGDRAAPPLGLAFLLVAVALLV
jgi:predicted metal-binding membrane protein